MSVCVTGEAAGLSQQEGAPGHEEEEGRLQKGEVSQLGELGHVTRRLRAHSTEVRKLLIRFNNFA